MALERFNVGKGIGTELVGKGGLASFLETISNKMQQQSDMQAQIGGQVGLHQALQQVDPEARFKAKMYGGLEKEWDTGSLTETQKNALKYHLLGLGKPIEQVQAEATAEQTGKNLAPLSPSQQQESALKTEQIRAEKQKISKESKPLWKRYIGGTPVPGESQGTVTVTTIRKVK